MRRHRLIEDQPERAELLGSNAVKLFLNKREQSLLLLLVQELRVTDNVDEENMPDFEAKIVVRFRHRLLLREPIRCGDVFLRRRF